jgi:hypothetical protein
MSVATNAEPVLSQAAVDARRIAEWHKQGGAPPGPDQDGPSKPEGVENLCPFGCEDSELSDIGHCKHLIGFSSNGKTFEPQTKRMRPAREADGKIIRDDNGVIQSEWDGAWITDGKHPQLVRETDHLVNGGVHTRPGVSSRVYRKDADVFNQP